MPNIVWIKFSGFRIFRFFGGAIARPGPRPPGGGACPKAILTHAVRKTNKDLRMGKSVAHLAALVVNGCQLLPLDVTRRACGTLYLSTALQTGTLKHRAAQTYGEPGKGSGVFLGQGFDRVRSDSGTAVAGSDRRHLPVRFARPGPAGSPERSGSQSYGHQSPAAKHSSRNGGL